MKIPNKPWVTSLSEDLARRPIKMSKIKYGCEVCFTCIFFNINCFECRWPVHEPESFLEDKDDDYTYEKVTDASKYKCGLWKGDKRDI